MQEQQNLLPEFTINLNKKKIALMAYQSVDRAIDRGNELELSEMLSSIEWFIKEIKANDDFRKSVIVRIEQYGKSVERPSGCKLELAEVGTKYDYSQCNDDDLVVWQKQYNELEDAIKGRQDMLKTLPAKGIEIAMTTTGEVKTIYPPSKSSTSSYKVTLAK